MISLHFLVTAFVVVLAPGTGVIFTLALGLGRGRRAALWAALGCTIGILPHLVAATLGLAAVLHSSALMPPFLSGSATSATQEMMALGAVFVAMTFAVFVLYGLFAARARSLILGSDAVIKWLNRSFAAIFAALAVRLAMDRA